MSQRLDAPRTERTSLPFHAIPRYLQSHYWWAYVHPAAVRLFERAWLVNLILWRNYLCLSEAALDALGSPMAGRTLQIACVYGNLTERLAERIERDGGGLDVVDVLPIQLANLRRKLPARSKVRLMLRDSTDLAMPDGSYDRALLFFLLHEQPEAVRRATLTEALRVVRPGGTIVIVDYARPAAWHPLRLLWLPVLRVLEPFARDLWRHDLSTWLPADAAARPLERKSFFGGLYQVATLRR